jgi:hypothetical protein
MFPFGYEIIILRLSSHRIEQSGSGSTLIFSKRFYCEDVACFHYHCTYKIKPSLQFSCFLFVINASEGSHFIPIIILKHLEFKIDIKWTWNCTSHWYYRMQIKFTSYVRLRFDPVITVICIVITFLSPNYVCFLATQHFHTFCLCPISYYL